jgi:hypothetical protein
MVVATTKSESILKWLSGAFYIASFLAPALSNSDGEILLGWQAFVYLALLAFPVWIGNVFFILGFASELLGNRRFSTIMACLAMCCAGLGVVYVARSDATAVVGFYLWCLSFFAFGLAQSGILR